MEDYQIKLDEHGTTGVSAQTGHAQKRGAGPPSYERPNAYVQNTR